ncbi:unnamed protein product, partial [Rotaria sp. Silwood1]
MLSFGQSTLILHERIEINTNTHYYIVPLWFSDDIVMTKKMFQNEVDQKGIRCDNKTYRSDVQTVNAHSLSTPLENIIDWLNILQQQQQKRIDFLQKEYNNTIKTRVNFEDIHLLETLSKENVIRLFRHIENIDEQIDWYNQLAQFLIQDHDLTSKRLRYSFVFKLLNDERQQIFIFLKQTIGQLKEKYLRIEMLNDEPVIVYLIRLIRNTLRPNLLQIQSTTDDWNKEINLLLLQRKKINESWVKKFMDRYLIRVQTIEEENKRSQQDYDLKCRQVQERIQ